MNHEELLKNELIDIKRENALLKKNLQEILDASLFSHHSISNTIKKNQNNERKMLVHKKISPHFGSWMQEQLNQIKDLKIKENLQIIFKQSFREKLPPSPLENEKKDFNFSQEEVKILEEYILSLTLFYIEILESLELKK